MDPQSRQFVVINLNGGITGNEENEICDKILNLKNLMKKPETKLYSEIQEINSLLKKRFESFNSAESKILKMIHQVFWPTSGNRGCCFKMKRKCCCQNLDSFEKLEQLLKKVYKDDSGQIQLFPYLFHSKKQMNSGKQKFGVLLHFKTTEPNCSQDNRIYVDTNGRVYTGLYDWLHNNWLPWGYVSYPKDGNYEDLKYNADGGDVILHTTKTPGLKNQIVEKVEIIVLILVAIAAVAVWLIEGFPTEVALMF